MDEEVESLLGKFLTDEEAMRLAIKLSAKGLGFVSPNPAVGCVILDSKNHLLGSGYHRAYGQAHAEVEALKGLTSTQLKDARVFVTLEPCAHQGKTGSCAKHLAQLPIAEVIYGLMDPNPLVSGKGEQILLQSGKKVRCYEGLRQELEVSCEHFLYNFRKQEVFVSLKVASSLDGQLALKSGDSKWITSQQARNYGHYLRAIHDLTLVGKKTILQDNPLLNIRHQDFPNKKNQIAILDTKAELLKRPELNFWKQHRAEDIFLLVGSGPDQSDACQILKVDLIGSQIDLNAAYRQLWARGVKSVLVEGGAACISSHILQKKARKLYLFQAPILLGAKGSTAWSVGVSIDSMDHKIALGNLSCKAIGPDYLLTGYFGQQGA